MVDFLPKGYREVLSLPGPIAFLDPTSAPNARTRRIRLPPILAHLPSTFSVPLPGYQGWISRSIDKIPAPPTRTASAMAINARFIS